ncbi:hypothetical protein BDQ94DRAFT_164669 [Aspergillus welwitschiae]|uniref:Uncharacterized protein n=1 Tax=Aspergillus welwitschiae TaxID=1341132 RepID=A0A3F3PH05_9EURO|nr:hypothetical protein BDQ94DRAFT_164669 [Aspergillus welwitschiae]RDH26214.1 hypothetical protein BDQ94DRAFT_164669 [Aspergillus welwitschiae]
MDRENENVKLSPDLAPIHQLTAKVSGTDTIYMQEECIRIPPNCEFCIDDLDQPDWYYPFRNSEFIHVGGLGGDRQLLTCILHGAYRYGLTPRIAHANPVSGAAHQTAYPYGETGLHRLYNDMNKAFRMDGRSLDLPLQYLSEMESHGFTNVAEHVYRIPLNTAQPITQKSVLESWADGFEAYSMDLLVKHLRKRHLEVFLICAAARQALRKGVEGWLEM